MRTALLAEEGAGARTLRLLARTPQSVAALLTSPDGPLWALGRKLGLRPTPARRVHDTDFPAELAATGAELLLNVHSLHIVPPAVLGVPTYGAYNLHPGPLPDYAGLNAPSWAIYNDEARHGVTLHRMEPGIDTGPIAFQESFAIEPRDTGLSLSMRCIEHGLTFVERLLDDPVRVTLARQDGARRYFGRGVPQDGVIDWRAPARRIDAFVRACDYHPFRSPWGTPRARVGEDEVEVLKTALTGERCAVRAGSVRRDGATLRVATGDEWIELRRVKTLEPSGASTPARAVISH